MSCVVKGLVACFPGFFMRRKDPKRRKGRTLRPSRMRQRCHTVSRLSMRRRESFPPLFGVADGCSSPPFLLCFGGADAAPAHNGPAGANVHSDGVFCFTWFPRISTMC